MRKPTLRRTAVGVLQYGIAILAFAWLLSQVEFSRLAALVATVDVGTALALVGVTGLGLVARFYTWHALIGRVVPSDIRAAADIDLVVNFVNQLLPSRLSGRAVAPLILRSRTGMEYAPAVAVAGVHTGLYAVCYGIGSLLGLGLALGSGRLSTGLLALLAISTGLYLAAGAFVLLAGANLGAVDRLVGAASGILRRVPGIGAGLAERVRSLPAFTTESAEWFRRLPANHRVLLLYLVAFGVAMLIAPGVRVWLLLESFGASFEPAVLLPIYLLTAYSVTLLPVTPGGIGISEATATAVFVALGVPVEVIVPVVFVDRFLGVYLPALAGWYPSLQLDVSGMVVD